MASVQNLREQYILPLGLTFWKPGLSSSRLQSEEAVEEVPKHWTTEGDCGPEVGSAERKLDKKTSEILTRVG